MRRTGRILSVCISVVILVTSLALGFPDAKASDSLNVGSLSGDRVDIDDFEFADGPYYDEAREELADPANFGPNGVVDCQFAILPAILDITSENLENTDIFWIPLLDRDSLLTAEEQQTIHDYVLGGGTLVIVADVGPRFSVGPSSVGEPFGVTWSDEPGVNANPTITDGTHPMIDGPFGKVEMIGHASQGFIEELGSYAKQIAVNPKGISIAWIGPNWLGSGSGIVILFSDVNHFSSNGTPWGPGFDRYDNRILFRNLFAYLTTRASAVIQASIDIKPDTLNMQSQGNWITAYIELPEGYSPVDIDVSTILLDNIIRAETEPVDIEDEDGNGLQDLMVKFDRASVIDYLMDLHGDSTLRKGRPLVQVATLRVTGMLHDESLFAGSDTIRTLLFVNVETNLLEPEADHSLLFSTKHCDMKRLAENQMSSITINHIRLMQGQGIVNHRRL